MYVLKRSGQSVEFDQFKIYSAIFKASEACGENLEPIDIEYITHKVVKQLADPCTVEQIQDIVEKTLIKYDFEKTAKAYILYRAQRAKLRNFKTELMEIYDEIVETDAIDSDIKRENANVDGNTAMGSMLKFGSEGAKYYVDKYVLPEKIAKAHIDGDIHIHDKDFYLLTETCISENSFIAIQINNEDRIIQAKRLLDIFPELNTEEQLLVFEDNNFKILSGGKFTPVKNAITHSANNKTMLRIQTRSGVLEVTSDHRVSVLRNNKIEDIKAKDLTIDDVLVSTEINPDRFTLSEIDLIDLFKDNNNIVITNTKEVIDNIKESGNKKELNQIFDYKSSYNVRVREGLNRLTIPEFLQIEHLTSLKRCDLQLCYKRSRASDSINAILPLTKELGKFIGLMYSEGSTSTYIDKRYNNIEKLACFVNFDESLIDNFNACAKTFINNATLKERITDGERSGTLLTGYLIYELFHGPFGIKNNSGDIHMPDWMLTANKEFISGLIGGIIDGDGYVQHDNYRIGISSSCLDFLKDLQLLLSFRGIATTIRVNSSNLKGSYAAFTKNNETIKCKRKYTNYYLESTGNLKNKFGWIDSFKIQKAELKDSDKLPNKYLKIKSIEVLDEYFGKVFDFETETHHFDVNGFQVHNCCQIDLIKLFKNGFSTGHGYLREPQSIQSYASLACIAIQANQNEMHGGQSVPNFDYSMAPGVTKSFKKNFKAALIEALMMEGFSEKEAKEKIEALEMPTIRDYKDWHKSIKTDLDKTVIAKCSKIAGEVAYNKTEKDTYQAMEGLVHNLNTMNSRAGAQVPFSSINYGTDTSPEGRMVMKNLLLATEAGLGNGETAIFPVQIFKVKEGINYNEGEPNYDLFKLAIRVSAKRLFPNFSFLDAPFNLSFYKEGDYNSEVAYMGCRTRVMANHHDPTKAVVCGRGNLSFTSINLPRIAIESNKDFHEFYRKLDEMLELVSEQLLHRLKIQSSKKVKNYPFLMGQGIWIDSEKLDWEDSVEEVLKEGTLSIGFIGLAEAMVAMTGQHHGESEESRKIAYEIIKHMREFCDKKSDETNLNFTLLATPAEGLSGRFVKIDKKKYGEIPGVTDRAYYTNSFHVPVYYPISAFDKISIEAPYHNLTNAGHISYVELDGDTSKNLEAFEAIIRHMKETGIGYGSINHAVDRDPVCGYVGIIDDVCPRCGRKVDEPVTIEKLNELRKKYPNVPVPCDCNR